MVQTSRKSGNVNELDTAYIAGLFDGEGSVTYSRRRQKKGTNKKYYMFDYHCVLSKFDNLLIFIILI